MKIVIEDSYENLSERAAGAMLAAMLQDKRVNIAITAGNSPVLTYQRVLEAVKANPAGFANVHYYNFDEIPIKGQTKGVTMRELDRLFFTPAGIPASRIHPLTLENYEKHADTIEEAGGLDFMLIGLGGDGHFCGNMPGETRFEEYIYKIHIKKEYEWYETILALGLPETPDYFVTMGAASVMKARRLAMIVNGAGKAQIVKRFLGSPVDASFPASILKLHPNFTLILDKNAASAL
ncbi:MAG: glucosamine-6-phosphate deaminase [Treponema sp.]|jgi:6-phosphogluconolactonase/glucosamine-6-phosphate isomerase/deaminase|nr:glucosamine-6-phosphate deaminase [Treponema sp.]